MAVFSKLVITSAGQALLANMIAGTGSAKFTKVCASSAAYEETELEGLTELTEIVQTSLVSKITQTNDVSIKVEASFTNNELTEGYYMRALGLYALDTDDNEILYAVTTETTGNCYMPAYNGVTVSGVYVQLVTTVGNAENVSLEVDAAAVATVGDIKELQEEIDELSQTLNDTDSILRSGFTDGTVRKTTIDGKKAYLETSTDGRYVETIWQDGGAIERTLYGNGGIAVKKITYAKQTDGSWQLTN